MSKVDEIKKLAEDTWEDNKAYIKEDFLKHGNEDGPSETIDEIAIEADGPVYTEDCAKLCMDYFNQESTGFSFDLASQMGEYDDWVEHTTNLSRVISTEIFREVLSEKLGNEIDSWKEEYNNKVNRLKAVADDIWEDNKRKWKEDYLKDGSVDQPYADIDDIAIKEAYAENFPASEVCEDYFKQEKDGLRVNYQDGIDADVSPDNWKDHADQLARVLTNEIIRTKLLDHVHSQESSWEQEYNDRSVSGPGM